MAFNWRSLSALISTTEPFIAHPLVGKTNSTEFANRHKKPKCGREISIEKLILPLASGEGDALDKLQGFP
jgi:hypothetical protein